MRWVRLTEAARRSGETPDAMRQRIERGTFTWPAEKRGRHWWVGLPEPGDQQPIGDRSTTAHDASEPIDVPFQVLTDQSLALFDRLTERYTSDLRALSDTLEAAYSARLADKDRLIEEQGERLSEWQERAQEAREEADRLRDQLRAVTERSRRWWKVWER